MCNEFVARVMVWVCVCGCVGVGGGGWGVGGGVLCVCDVWVCDVWRVLWCVCPVSLRSDQPVFSTFCDANNLYSSINKFLLFHVCFWFTFFYNVFETTVLAFGLELTTCDITL